MCPKNQFIPPDNIPAGVSGSASEGALFSFRAVRMFASMIGVMEFAAVCCRRLSIKTWICDGVIVL
jgi:hypothetical protein